MEKLGTSEKATSQKLCEQRRCDPDAAPTPVCGHYCGRLEQLALLEFDCDRKSMSVLCRPVPHTRHSSELFTFLALGLYLVQLLLLYSKRHQCFAVGVWVSVDPDHALTTSMVCFVIMQQYSLAASQLPQVPLRCSTMAKPPC